MVCEVVCVLGFTVGGMLSAEVVPAAGWGVVGFSGGVLVLWGACGICCLGWVVLGALLVLVVEGFDGLGPIGLCGLVGVEGDVVGLAAGVLFVFGVVMVAGLGMVGNGLDDVDFSAVVWLVLVLSRRRLSAKASRKLFMCLWENIMDLLVPMQSAAAHVNRPLSYLLVCCGKSAVFRVCHFVFLSPGAAARRLHSFFEYSVCVSLL